ncbi:MAG TPA: response regulator [Burkholderiales bacterium]|jgi:DNA-binding response OmpR family regulator|nr:response regulator [Burkholderiales bacterium]
MATRAQEALKEPRHRVLIVDDEESTRMLLARLLTKELNVEAQLAGTCEQALKLAGNFAYDAILLDLLMPGIGGLGVLAALRAQSPNSSTPVIIVSVVTDQETVDRAMAAGANAYHVKPVRRAELIATVRSQLAKRGQPRH